MRNWSKRALLTFLERVEPALDQVDHFELLDVSIKSDDATIQAAFHEMAAGLHPDRHRHSLSPEQYERLTIVYARIAEAYRVLRSPDNRRRYLEEAARAQKRAPKAPRTAEAQNPETALALLSPKAQRLYRRAAAARKTGDLASAVLNLQMALALHPQSGFLRATRKSWKKADS